MSEMPRTERTVLVKGACSAIGRASARLLAREGFRAFGTSRRKQPDADGDPSAVARLVVKAARAGSPRLRYAA